MLNNKTSFSNIGLCLLICLLVTGCITAPVKEQNDSANAGMSELELFIANGEWDKGVAYTLPESHEFILSNGLKVVVVEKHDIPMIYARAQIRGGSIYDPTDLSGLAYLTGWVLTEGTQSYPDEVIDSAMDSHGAVVTSVAYNESCISTLTCLSKDTSTLFPYFAEIISRPAFDPRVIEESRQYLIGDLMRKMDDPGEVCRRVFRNEVFHGHPYQKQQTGTVEGFQNISRQDVLDFFDTYYRPDRAALVIVGDITAMEVRKLCETHLMSWEPSGKPLPIVVSPRPVEGMRITLIDMPTAQAQITMGHVGINRTNPDRFKLYVLNKILGGGGLYTRLAEEVRVKRGLTYGIYCYFARREYTGEFMLNTFTKAESTDEVIDVCLHELQCIRQEQVSDQELADAKMSLIGGHPLQYEQYEDIAQTLVHMNFYGLPMSDVTNYAQNISRVTAEDVRQAARKYLHPDDMIITVVGPADIIKADLEKIGPVDVVKPV
ncbi:insulinase family protein [bacterium]|nr:insulinase family protein [bacterium]